MRTALILIATSLLAGHAYAAKDCNELKSEIEAKLNAKGVQNYSLEIIAAADEATAGGKIVGSCGGGTQRIAYHRPAKTADAAPAATPSSQP